MLPVPDKAILHKMGYYSNQEGIALRYIREDENWNTHLANTKRFILNSVKKSKPPLVTVLGSGWLLDVPVSEMLKYTEKIQLIDLVHPPDILRSFATNNSVIPLIADVTGGLAALIWQVAGSGDKQDAQLLLEKVKVLEFEPDREMGMVLSVNLLSQLPTLPFEFLKRKKLINPEHFHPFSTLIQEKHLGFLKKHDAVLITDFAEIQTARNGLITREQIVHCRLPAGSRRQEWTWSFDSTGSYKQGFNTEMQVVAIHL
jgi:hypothetical protein